MYTLNQYDSSYTWVWKDRGNIPYKTKVVRNFVFDENWNVTEILFQFETKRSEKVDRQVYQKFLTGEVLRFSTMP